ncbi:hypothetical protein [Desulfogranum mediterraneum]|nr:hypothetical protein [Desulfogranum mediterraneum]
MTPPWHRLSTGACELLNQGKVQGVLHLCSERLQAELPGLKKQQNSPRP